MSSNTDPTKGCAGKQRFETFTAAKQGARKGIHRHGAAFQAYHCRHCAGFHYGSVPRQRPRVKPRPAARFHVELTTDTTE